MSHEITISSSCRRVLDLFESIVNAARLEGQASEISPSATLDATGRFKIWANNIGALLNSKNLLSLDARLEKAPKVKSTILDILEDLADALQDVFEIVSKRKKNRVDTVNGQHVSEVEEQFSLAEECTTSLMKISITVRSATTRDRFLRAEIAIANPMTDAFDVAHLAQKYPKVEQRPWLKSRIGAAMTRRRQFLHYSRDHRGRLRGDADEEKARTVIGSTKASTLQIERLEAAEEEVESQVSEATSFGVDEGTEAYALRVPSLSSISERCPFECPLCWGMQDIRSETMWR